MNTNLKIVGWRIPDDKGGFDYFFKEPSDFDKAYQKKLYKRDFEPVYVVENLPCYIDRFVNRVKVLTIGDVIDGMVMTPELVDNIIEQANDRMPLFGETNSNFKPYIDMIKASHSVLSLYVEDGILFADFKILNTPCGDILLENYDKLYPVLRYFGTEKDFKLITLDFKHE